jgi:hypothetical protein
MEMKYNLKTKSILLTKEVSLGVIAEVRIRARAHARARKNEMIFVSEIT